MTGPFGEGPYTGRRGGKKSPREKFGPGWGGRGGCGAGFGFGAGRGKGRGLDISKGLGRVFGPMK